MLTNPLCFQFFFKMASQIHVKTVEEFLTPVFKSLKLVLLRDHAYVQMYNNHGATELKVKGSKVRKILVLCERFVMGNH